LQQRLIHSNAKQLVESEKFFLCAIKKANRTIVSAVHYRSSGTDRLGKRSSVELL
jgi:hypothetical protein